MNTHHRQQGSSRSSSVPKAREIIKNMERRQLGQFNDSTFIANSTFHRLASMKFCHEIVAPDFPIVALELSVDNELLLTAGLDQIKIFDAKGFNVMYDKNLRSMWEFNYPTWPGTRPTLSMCLRWNRGDNSLFTKSGGSGTLEVWDSASRNCPLDSSPASGEPDFKVYSYHSPDPFDICALAGVEAGIGVNILDLRIGLDTPTMQLQPSAPSSAVRGSGKQTILNASYNPVERNRVTTIVQAARLNEPTTIQLCDYDLRNTGTPLFTHHLPTYSPHGSSHPDKIQIVFTKDAQKLYTIVSGQLYCFSTTDGKLLRQTNVQTGYSEPKFFCVSRGASPECIFVPQRQGVEAYNADNFNCISTILLPNIAYQMPALHDAIPLALDTDRQTLFVGHLDLQIYAAVPDNVEGDGRPPAMRLMDNY